MISIQSLRHERLAVDTLEIAPGITTVIGANGSGKTTLLAILAGIILPEAGTVLVDGVPPRKSEIGWVGEFPDRNFIFSRVFDEIACPLRFRHVPAGTIPPRVQACMEVLGISPFANRMVQDLSGGEKVMVALGAALVANPDLLILDECDSQLDATRALEVERAIRISRVRYVVRSTQQMDAAARGDHLIFLERGGIAQAGTPAQVFGQLARTPFYPLSWRCRP
ncbi:MAG TPA: ABC transporter ATP-binding protein [Methanoregula sp.]|nr:ABC transporter ATP-binding protein [Methanoregula sp.]